MADLPSGTLPAATQSIHRDVLDPFIRSNPVLDSRPSTVHALKTCWRNAPMTQVPGFDTLMLVGDIALPELHADFSHVRTLSLRGRAMVEGNIGQILGNFANVQELTLGGADAPGASAPQALEGLHRLTRLNIVSGTELTPAELARLEGMTGLEQLSLYSTLSSSLRGASRA